MNFSPNDLEEVKTKAARMIAEAAMEEAGGAMSLVILPLSVVTQITSLSRHSIPRYLPVTEISPGKHGVTLRDLQAYIAGKTAGVAGKAKTAVAPAVSAI